MTNTDLQMLLLRLSNIELANAGSELVRLTINNDAAAKAVIAIKESLIKHNCDVPLIGDFHYNGHNLLNDNPAVLKFWQNIVLIQVM